MVVPSQVVKLINHGNTALLPSTRSSLLWESVPRTTLHISTVLNVLSQPNASLLGPVGPSFE